MGTFIVYRCMCLKFEVAKWNISKGMGINVRYMYTRTNLGTKNKIIGWHNAACANAYYICLHVCKCWLF